MKKALFTLAMLASAGMAFSLPVGGRQAQHVAQQFWATIGGKADLLLVEQTDGWPYSALRLFTAPAPNPGWVLVAADDVARPVLAYSLTTPMRTDSLPPQLAGWLQDYQDQIALAIEAGLPPSPEWTSPQVKSGSFAAIEPLCSTRWDQTDPYNAYTPSRTPVGCAATAQAQVMKFWNFPAFGKGENSYDCPNFGVQSADFGHTLYQWDLMPDVPPRNTPAEARHALSTLLYHIGVALNMNYSFQGSGALGFAGYPGTPSNDNSLIDYFCYKNTLEVKDRNEYTDDEWRDLFIEELSHRRPILCQGYDLAVGGHGWVCDGNDTIGNLHMNFGWSGVGDGYYAVGAINPGIGSQGQLGDYRFNNGNMAIIKIEPDYAMRVSDTILSLGLHAGADSLLFGINDTCADPWSVSVDAAWVTVRESHFERAGWVGFDYAENTTGTERFATLTFTQGGQQLTVRLVQNGIDESSLCPLTVVMEATRYAGWQGGAYLSLESPQSYVYGTAALSQGTSGEATIYVPDQTVKAVWHSGGGTDRYINYRILSPSGETLVDVEYAYTAPREHTLEAPCTGLAIDEAEADGIVVRCLRRTVEVAGCGDGLVELFSIDGRRVDACHATGGTIRLEAPSAGVYMLRAGTHIARKVVVR